MTIKFDNVNEYNSLLKEANDEYIFKTVINNSTGHKFKISEIIANKIEECVYTFYAVLILFEESVDAEMDPIPPKLGSIIQNYSFE